jgi:hypothetical protein
LLLADNSIDYVGFRHEAAVQPVLRNFNLLSLIGHQPSSGLKIERRERLETHPMAAARLKCMSDSFSPFLEIDEIHEILFPNAAGNCDVVILPSEAIG